MRDISLARSVLLGSALAVVFANGSAAWAADASDNGSAIETVVVTAEKRVERLQDVPVAVSVVSTQQLRRDNILRGDELQYAVPELSFNGNYSIRGVSTQSFSRTSENDVAVIIDGIVQGQQDVPVSALFDVSRVEVLSGPQGMLFGRNASAGAINIVSNAPDLTKQEFLGHVEFGENAYQVYQGVVNLPLDDTMGLRVAGFSENETGRVTNVFNGSKQGGVSDSGGRARFLWQPTSNFTLNVIADYEKKFGSDLALIPRQATPPMSLLLASCGITASAHNYKVCQDGANYGVSENYGATIQADWNVGGVTLTSLTGDRQYTSVSQGDSDNVPINLLNINSPRNYDNQFSQEFRITSPTGERLEYVAGVYFYNFAYNGSSDQAGTLGILPFVADRLSYISVNTSSYAAYGQATYHVTDDFSLIGGGRFTRDVIRETTINTYNPAEGLPVPGFTGSGTFPSSIETDNFSYKLGAQYKFAPDTMAYITYGRGYKAGTIADAEGRTTPPPIVKPEIPTDWELGLKTSLFDNRMSLDVALFDENFKDFQAQVFEQIGGISQFVLSNASKLEARGVQANIVASPIDGLTLNGGVIYNDATYGNFIVPCDVAHTAGCTLVGGQLVTNAKGEQLFAAPRWKFNLGGQYDVPLDSGLDAFAAADVSYRSSTLSTATPDPNTVVPGYAIVNARLGVHIDDHYSVSVFARNLFNKREPELIIVDPIEGGANYDAEYSSSASRVIGVSLDADL